MNDFYKNSEITTTVKAGEPGTKKLLKQENYTGNVVRVRYYKHKVTGEVRKTIEIEPTEGK